MRPPFSSLALDLRSMTGVTQVSHDFNSALSSNGSDMKIRITEILRLYEYDIRSVLTKF